MDELPIYLFASNCGFGSLHSIEWKGLFMKSYNVDIKNYKKYSDGRSVKRMMSYLICLYDNDDCIVRFLVHNSFYYVLYHTSANRASFVFLKHSLAAWFTHSEMTTRLDGHLKGIHETNFALESWDYVCKVATFCSRFILT